MEWLLLISLYSSDDVYIGEQKSYKSCVENLKKLKKKYRKDEDIKDVKCVKGVIVNEYIAVEGDE